MEPCLQRGNGNIQHLGSLFIAEHLNIPQNHRRLQVFRQQIQSPLQMLPKLAVQRQLFRTVGRADQLHVVVARLREEIPGTVSAELHQCNVDCDSVQPGAHFGFTAEPGEVSVSGQKCVLGGILGVGSAPQDPVSQVINEVTVFRYDFFKLLFYVLFHY